MAKRILSTNSTKQTAMENSLNNYDPFILAHLVKFEKPVSATRATNRDASNYAYITDNAYDIDFDDGSKNADGSAHNAQTYRANKLQSIGTVNENIVAKAASMTIKLDSTALGASIDTTGAFSASSGNGTFAGNASFSDEGFVEGDTIYFSGVTKPFTIVRFFNDGKSIEYTTEATSLNTSSASYTVTLSSEIIDALLTNKSDLATGYSSYINREIFIYKCHINPETRQIIGEPFLYFKGIVTKGAIKEGLTSSSITWTLSSHWGDFEQINGRLSDDATHRALDSLGESDTDSLIRPEYKADFGFYHSQTAVYQNIQYIGYETKYRQVDINGGWGGGKRLREYQAEVERNTFLDIQLKSQHIPVVYGVQKVSSFPVFVDTNSTNTNEVYKVDVICEGHIAGIYDMLIDGQSLICNDTADRSTRGDGYYSGDTPPNQVCVGVKSNGDTLAANPNSTIESTTCVNPAEMYNLAAMHEGVPGRVEHEIALYSSCLSTFGTPTYASFGEFARGLVHKGEFDIPEPTPMQSQLKFFAGTANQTADPRLVKIASSGGDKFTIQKNFYENARDIPYWSSSHRLLDTAYISNKLTIKDGETKIPDPQYIVKGKFINCHNYDESYGHRRYPAQATNNRNNFHPGDLVDIYALPDDSDTADTSSDTQLSSQVRIIDKFRSIGSDEEETTVDFRFRWETPPNVTGVKHFYMKKDSYIWYMTNDMAALHTDTTPDLVVEAALDGNASVAGTNSGTVKVTLDSGVNSRVKNFLNLIDDRDDISQSLPILRFYTGTGADQKQQGPSVGTFTYISSGDKIDNVIAQSGNYTKVDVANAIALDNSTAKNIENFYRKMQVVFTRIEDGVNGKTKKVQKKTITYYDHNTKIALVDSRWDGDLPGTDPSNETIEVKIGEDLRCSSNPAMQLLDYMTSNRYGQGLDLDNDIDLDSFKQAAKDCDERSDVSVVVSKTVYDASSLAVDQVFVYPASYTSGNLQFRGTIKSISNEFTEGTLTGRVITFKDVIGKLGRKWNDRELFPANQLYWHDGMVFAADGSTTYTNTPTSSDSNKQTTIALQKEGSGTPGTLVQIDITKSSANGNALVKGYDPIGGRFAASGYSLYDSDDVKYWRYAGWDDNQQRNVTRHQLNQTIDTATPLFDNIQRMLPQFNGILRYSAGKYTLNIKGKKGTLDAVEQITEDDIIGDIVLNDGGLKQSKNYMSANIIDPANNFEGRSVTYFNSQYLKQDKGIQKKGNVAIPGITNYFNARMQVEQALRESRYGLDISFTMSPKGLLLTAGSIIEITYPRFGFNPRAFRIINLNFKKDGTVDVTAREHDDSIYKITEDSGPRGIVDGKDKETDVGAPNAPTALQWVPNSATNFGKIQLFWVNSSSWNSSTHLTEIYRSRNQSYSATKTAGSLVVGQYYTIKTKGNTDFTDIGAPVNTVGTVFMATGVGSGSGTVDELVLVGTSDSNTFVDTIDTGSAYETRYYWIRYRVKRPGFNVSGSNFRNVFSDYHPATNANGVEARAHVNSTSLSRAVQLSTPNDTRRFAYNNDGTTPSPATLVITATPINANGGTRAYNFTVDGTSVQNSSTATYTYTPQASMSNMPQTIGVTLTHVVDGVTYTATDNITLSSHVPTEINGSLLADGTVSETQLNSSTNTSLDLADSASQVNVGLALITNKHKNADNSLVANNGDAILVGVDKNGTPIVTQNGFIQWEGSKITIETNQYNSGGDNILTILTGSPNKKGFIIFDTAKGDPFTVHGGGRDVAFAWKIGTQWYYDNNGDNAGTSFTPAASYVALGYLETTTSDLITKGGLFGHPVPVDQAAFPGDEQISGLVGGWKVNENSIFTGTEDTSGYNDANDITINKTGGIHANKFYIDGSDGSAHFKGAIEGGSIGGENTNAIPSTVFSRTVAQSKGAPTGNETGGFIDLTTGDFVFGDASTFISFAPTSDDSSSPARKLTLKGDLEAENLTVTSSISTPLLKVGRLESGTVRVADIREEVFSEIDSRLGNTGGYYASYETAVSDGNTDDGYQGEDPTAPYVKVLDGSGSGYAHAGETTFLNFALNDQFAAPVALSTNTSAGRHPNDLKITAKFQKKIAGQADSTYVNVGSIRTFTLTETLIPYATRYTAEFSMSETITTDSSGDATDPNNHISGTSYIYRIVLAAVAQPGGSNYKSYFKTYYDSGGNLEGIGANDQAASPVFFEIREGSIGSSAGNLDTAQFITHTADNDTNIEFLDDKIKLNAGGQTMITLTEDTTDTITLHKDTTVSTNLTVSGTLTVAGTSTTLNTTDLNVKDKNIVLNYHATGDTSATANGAGITIQDAVDASTDATILWDNSNDEFDFSHPVNVSGVVKSEHDSNNFAQIESNSSGGVIKAVANNVATAMIRSYGDSFFDTDTLYIDASENNVGIGTTTPKQQLHVSGGTSSGDVTKVAIGATGTNAESHLQLAERFDGNDMNYGFAFITDGNNTNNLLLNHYNNSTTGSTGLCMARGTGFIGLGTTSPTRRLHIVDTSNTPETDRSAVHIDMNLSDADPEVALTADKTARGILVDVDSTVSSGGTDDEHRIYGINVDLDINTDGDSDVAYGMYSHAQVNSNAGQTSALRGYHGHAVNDNEGTHRTSVTMGGHFLADHRSESSTAEAQSYYGSNNIVRFLGDATVDAQNLYGALNEVEINPADGTAGKVDGNIAATYSLIDNNDSTDDEIEVGNSFLFFGTYSPNDTGFGNHRSGTRSYGIYVQSDVPNFFAGKVGINGGATAPEYQLDIGRETSSTDNTIRIAQANGGTAIRVGTGSGSSDVTLLRVDGESTNHNGESDNSQFGFSLKYMGSRSDNSNSLSIFSDNQSGTAVEAVTVFQDGSVGINQTSPAARVQIEDLGIETTSTAVSSTNATVVDTFAKATFRTARYTVQITQGSAYQCSDIMAIHDGTTAIGTEYAMLETGSVLGTLAVDINGDNVELKVTMAAADAATVKVIRHCVAV